MKKLAGLFLLALMTACTHPKTQQDLSIGKQLSFQRNKGNCLACHVIDDGEAPGNIGPALQHIQTRFTTKEELKALIWDATQFNPQTSMPPFGKNKILTPDEVDHVVDYIWSLNR
ncbi:MAG: sulfur oxidation c-type cytochrome SoxX [Methylococcaceae bacterium]|nr:sulfur oxidation c-type cytochrome SoxX [Methylococcaceae bacterium]